MTNLYKIAFSALFIALGIILSRFFSLPYLFGLPFLKISFSMSVIFFASFYLGPLYGTIVSFAVDFFGALLFPQGGPYDFLFSIPAIIQGFVPYFVYKFLEKVKADKKYPIVLGILMLLIDAFILIFVLTHDTFSYTTSSTEYEFTPALKVIIPTLFFAISIIFYIGILLFKRKYKERKINQYYNLYILAASMFLTYFLFKIPISAAIFMYRYEYSFEIVYGVRALTGFLTAFVHYIIVVVALNVSLKSGVKGALLPKDLLAVNREVEEVKEGENK